MNKEILCKCLLERKDEILVFTNFTSLVLTSTMIALLVILFIMEKYVFQVFIDGDTEKMVLRSSEVEKGIQYYFSKYKGENCNKLHSRTVTTLQE